MPRYTDRQTRAGVLTTRPHAEARVGRLVRIPSRSLYLDGECNRRLRLGRASLCMRGEAALRTVARAANVPYPSD